MFGHWGHGCVHCRIDYDLRTVEGIAEFRRFMEEAADLQAHLVEVRLYVISSVPSAAACRCRRRCP